MANVIHVDFGEESIIDEYNEWYDKLRNMIADKQIFKSDVLAQGAISALISVLEYQRGMDRQQAIDQIEFILKMGT